MPNFCDNLLNIQGPKETIKALWEKLQEQREECDEEALMHTLITVDHGLAPTWENRTAIKEWWNANWGEGADITEETLEFSETDETATISGYFQTTWDAPINGYKNFEKHFPDCTIEASYYEKLNNFAGVYETEKGNLHIDNCHERTLDGAEEDELTPIFAELNELYNITEDYE